MKGQRLLVVCNLKPSKMVGFVSNGMVLCAKKDGKVEFIEPPAGAKIGERVAVEAFAGGSAPITSTQVKKKKVWEAVAEVLRTDGASASLPTVWVPCKAMRVFH